MTIEQEYMNANSRSLNLDYQMDSKSNEHDADAMIGMMTEEHGMCNIQINTAQHWQREPIKRVHIELEDLSYTVNAGTAKHRDILRSVSGCFRPEKLTVIFGPSGAGKTTLMNIISGLCSSNITGTILFNGHKNHTNVFRRQICYIPQEFALMPLLTTRETLYIATRLKLGHSCKLRAAQNLVVDTIAKSLSLTDCLDTLASNLSGGEKKRLAIGVEMITEPSVMLLDEPTSGLDSTASTQVITLLHTMAKSGCTVICAVHQPSSRMMSQFDEVLILTHGEAMYCGPKEDVLSTFKSAGYDCPQFYNPAEFVLEVVMDQWGGDLNKLHEIGLEHYNSRKIKNDVNQTIDEDFFTRDLDATSFWGEINVLFFRAIICIKRDNTLTKLRLSAHLAIGLLLGIVFYDFGNDASKVDSNVACIFFFLLFLFFSNSMPAVQMFPIEQAVFLREHLNHWYSLKSYYIVKVISDLPMQILCPTCFLSIAYYMTGQSMEPQRFFQVWIICILFTILGQSFGIATGAAFDTQLGVFLIPALNIPMFLFSGFFLKLGEVSTLLQPLCGVSYFRYAFEGALQALYGGDREPLRCNEMYCLFVSPRKILMMMNMPSVSESQILTVLILWILFLHVIIYTVLHLKLRIAQK